MRVPACPEDVFSGMLATLREPGSWTRFTAARDEFAQACSPSAPRACSWCILGAQERELLKITDPDQSDLLAEITDEILHEVAGGVSPSAVNDDPATTHATIIDLVTRAHTEARTRTEPWTEVTLQSASANASRNA